MNQSQLKLNKWIKKGNIFGEHRAQLPVVDIYPDRYRIYYSTRNDEGKSIPMFIEVDKNDLKQIITPPTKVDIKLGNPGMFDWAGIMPTEIVTMYGVKYLYYIGWSLRKDVPYHNSLGLAVSNDNGMTWKKYAGPVFSTNSIEYGYVGTAGIIVEHNLWRMWYLSCRSWIEHNGRLEPIYDIKYAESPNGVTWTTTKKMTAIPLQNNEGGISAARVFNDGYEYHMVFSVRGAIDYRTNSEQSYRIKSAHSFDGMRWTRNPETIIDISNDAWENFMVCYPYIIEDNNQRIMFYNGNNFGETGIGYAINE